MPYYVYDVCGVHGISGDSQDTSRRVYGVTYLPSVSW
jgi:hypothetical protein